MPRIWYNFKPHLCGSNFGLNSSWVLYQRRRFAHSGISCGAFGATETTMRAGCTEWCSTTMWMTWRVARSKIYKGSCRLKLGKATSSFYMGVHTHYSQTCPSSAIGALQCRRASHDFSTMHEQKISDYPYVLSLSKYRLRWLPADKGERS